MRIEQLQAGEAARVAPLFDAYRQFYKLAADVEAAEQYISARINSGESIIFLALDDSGNAIGFTQMYPTFCSLAAAPIMVLYDLFVVETGRKQGAGRALMVRAQSYALQAGAVRVDLCTTKDNHHAQALYESLGYIRDNEFYMYSLSFN